MGSRRIAWMALGLLLACLAAAVGLYVWRAQVPLPADLAASAAEIEERERLERDEQYRALQERLNVRRVADRLRDDLEAQERDRR
jgi:hypothetical protein